MGTYKQTIQSIIKSLNESEDLPYQGWLSIQLRYCLMQLGSGVKPGDLSPKINDAIEFALKKINRNNPLWFKRNKTLDNWKVLYQEMFHDQKDLNFFHWLFIEKNNLDWKNGFVVEVGSSGIELLEFNFNAEDHEKYISISPWYDKAWAEKVTQFELDHHRAMQEMDLFDKFRKQHDEKEMETALIWEPLTTSLILKKADTVDPSYKNAMGVVKKKARL